MLLVLAVGRNGERLQGKLGDIRLRPGDTLLLEAHSSFLEERRVSRDFYLVTDIPDSEPLRHEKAPLALAILVGMVLLVALNWMDMLKAASLAALLMLALGCCSPSRAFKNINWSVLLVIGAALGIGQALQATGAATVLADTVVSSAGDNPWVALALVYGVTTLLTECITNNAAAALVFPVALAMSESLGGQLHALRNCHHDWRIGQLQHPHWLSGPTSWFTALVGYRFSDFLRVGIPFNLTFFGRSQCCWPPEYFRFSQSWR